MLAALGLSTQLSPMAAPASAPQAELRLTVDRPVVARGEDPGYHVTIRNLGRTPLRLSDLQSGSATGAVNPSTDWVTPDLRGVDAMLGCGDYEAVRASRFSTLAPGASRELDASAIGVARLSPGANRVSLSYEIDPKRRDVSIFGMARPLAGTPEQQTQIDAQYRPILDAYRSLTTLRLTSNSVRVTLRVTP